MNFNKEINTHLKLKYLIIKENPIDFIDKSNYFIIIIQLFILKQGYTNFETIAQNHSLRNYLNIY